MFCRNFGSNALSSRFRVLQASGTHNSFLTRLIVAIIVWAMLVGLTPAYALPDTGDYEYNRIKLLDFVIRHDLEALHFSHKKIDDEASKAVLDLFLKQLDYQKRFLLQEDIEELRSCFPPKEGEAFQAEMKLANAGSEILARRVQSVQRMLKDILSLDFDFYTNESIETDSEKLRYCKTEDELKQRWTKIIKFQVLNQYLALTDESSLAKGSAPKDKAKASPKDLVAAAKEKVAKNYEAFFARTLQEKQREHYDRFFSALARAFDPHTDYMPETNKEDFEISMRGSLEGIGATLKEEDSFIKVVSIMPGGPAYKQGQLQAEDIILKVAEKGEEPVDLTDMRVTDAVKHIRGKKGTEVKLTVRKPDSSLVVIPIIRDVVQLEDTFAKGLTIEDPKNGRKFGYLLIPSFYRDFEKTRGGKPGRNVTDDVKKELDKLAKDRISGLIIDLRNNGGGALTDAVKIAGLFIGTGPVVQIKSNDDKMAVLNDDDPGIAYKGPILVLTNRLSASASEILAGALQDYGRAIIMGGEHTHGKGTVQSVIDLNEGIPLQNMDDYRTLGALRVTIQKFYRINGDSTQFRGVLPDIPVPDLLNHLKTGEQYLDYPLPWDKVKPTSYAKWQRCQPGLGDLRAKSSKRVAKSEEFRAIESENNRAVERQSMTVQSLNIDEVRKERQESRKLREKISEMNSAHGDTSSDKKPAEKKMTEKERKELWAKEVNKDAYVKEGMAVIEDMISADPTCIAATN